MGERQDVIGMLARPMFPFAVAEWRYRCVTEIEGVSKGMQGKEEKGGV
jgi:hypothetical protein